MATDFLSKLGDALSTVFSDGLHYIAKLDEKMRSTPPPVFSSAKEECLAKAVYLAECDSAGIRDQCENPNFKYRNFILSQIVSGGARWMKRKETSNGPLWTFDRGEWRYEARCSGSGFSGLNQWLKDFNTQSTGISILFGCGGSEISSGNVGSDEMIGFGNLKPKPHKLSAGYDCAEGPSLVKYEQPGEIMHAFCVDMDTPLAGDPTKNSYNLMTIDKSKSKGRLTSIEQIEMYEVNDYFYSSGSILSGWAFGKVVAIDSETFAMPFRSREPDAVRGAGILVYKKRTHKYSVYKSPDFDVSGLNITNENGEVVESIRPKMSSLHHDRWTYDPDRRELLFAASSFNEAPSDDEMTWPKQIHSAGMVVRAIFNEQNEPEFTDFGLTTKPTAFRLAIVGKDRDRLFVSSGNAGLTIDLMDRETLEVIESREITDPDTLDAIERGLMTASPDGEHLVVVGGNYENRHGRHCAHTLNPELTDPIIMGSKCFYIPTDRSGEHAYIGNTTKAEKYDRFYASDAIFDNSGRLYMVDRDFGILMGLDPDDGGVYKFLKSYAVFTEPNCGDKTSEGNYKLGLCSQHVRSEVVGFGFTVEDTFPAERIRSLNIQGGMLYAATPKTVIGIDLY